MECEGQKLQKTKNFFWLTLIPAGCCHSLCGALTGQGDHVTQGTKIEKSREQGSWTRSMFARKDVLQAQLHALSREKVINLDGKQGRTEKW